MKRFGDSRRSALDIIEILTQSEKFISQLTREYVIEGKILHRTRAGHVIDQDIGEARERYEKDLRAIKVEHNRALEAHIANTVAQLRSLSLQTQS